MMMTAGYKGINGLSFPLSTGSYGAASPFAGVSSDSICNNNNDSHSKAHKNQGHHKTNANCFEFPRHRLKFFNILGEGAFGQVWRCEAVDIDGKYMTRYKLSSTDRSEVVFNRLYYF